MDLLQSKLLFQYKPVAPHETRLVRLHKAELPGDPIRCSMLLKNEWQMSYEALSYEWGIPSDDDPEILIDECQFRVRRNLKHALVHIRLQDRDRYIWIDAICINQADNRERSAQVEMMGRIYTMADKVIVWLGLAADGSDEAIDLVDRIHSLDAASRHNYVPARRGGMNDISMSYNELRALLSLCTRPYWHRLWVIQEFQLARELHVYCGNKKTTSQALEHVYRYFSRHVNRPSADIDLDDMAFHVAVSICGSTALTSHIGKRSSMRPGVKGPGYDFRDWLFGCALSKEFQCTEPRDYVFALLSVSRNAYHGDIVPDYEKPIEEVFFDAMKKCHSRVDVFRVESHDIVWAKLLAEKLGMDGEDVPELLQAWTLSMEDKE